MYDTCTMYIGAYNARVNIHEMRNMYINRKLDRENCYINIYIQIRMCAKPLGSKNVLK